MNKLMSELKLYTTVNKVIRGEIEYFIHEGLVPVVGAVVMAIVRIILCLLAPGRLLYRKIIVALCMAGLKAGNEE